MELIATLAVGEMWAALLVAQWHHTRRKFGALCAEIRTEIQGLREDFRGVMRSLGSDIRILRADVRADSGHVRGDLTGLRNDIQALTVCVARIERFLVDYFAARGPRDRHDNA